MELIAGFFELVFGLLKLLVVAIYLTFQYWYIAIPAWICFFWIIGKVFPDGFGSGGDGFSKTYTVTTFGNGAEVNRTKVRVDNLPY